MTLLDTWPELVTVFRIALTLRRPVAEVLAMSAWEFNLWCDYRTKHGFDTDRLEGVTANAGSAAACAMGAKVKASELVPKFARERMAPALLIAKLSAMPGAKVRKITKEERAAKKKGKPRV